MNIPGHLPRELGGHAAMGAVLGAYLGISLIIVNTLDIFNAAISSNHPRLIIVLVVGLCALILSASASVTGWLFVRSDAWNAGRYE